MKEYTIIMDRRKYKDITSAQHSQNPSMILTKVDKLSMCGNMKR